MSASQHPRGRIVAALVLCVAAAAACDEAPADPASDAGADAADSGADATTPEAPSGRVAGVPADTVVDSWAPLDDAVRAINGVRGGGENRGSGDVLSVPYEPGTLTLTWSGQRVLDGPGPDLAVFENPFRVRGSATGTFMDPVIVEVSDGGEAWVAFPHDYLASDETSYSNDPADWEGFAGVTPVLLHEEENPVDPLDQARAGGDVFDLADLPEGEEGDAIRAAGFTHVRLTAAHAVTNPDTGEPFPRDAVSNGPDIDGVYVRAVVADSDGE